MLRHGASFVEIGAVLRHRAAGTTEIYAKVDLESLRRRGAAVARRGRCAMTSLATALDEYLAMRQGLGIRLRVPAGLLRRFVAFLHSEGQDVITRELAVQWAMAPRHAQPATWAWRLSIVRRFAIWRQASDPRTEVPAPGLLPHRFRRPRPHLYTDGEIRALLTAARALPSPRGLRGLTYATLFGLLAVTGLRVSEALMLDDADVALDQDLLTIRRTKFGKSRIVPVHRSTTEALMRYAEARDRLLPKRPTPAFFVSERGTRLAGDNTRHTFVLVSRRAGLRATTAGCRHGHGPRLHDMRHRFAASTLVAWYRAGRDVERELPKLATYSVTSMSMTRTGIWKPCRNCSNWPRPASRARPRRAADDGHQLSFLLQRFFTDRLRQQRQASPHTVAGYRDTFRLLLRFAAERLGRAPSALMLEDFTPTFVSDFLDHLERVRGNSNRTRNARLAAIHSFAQYVALNEPAHALLCQRLLAIPSRRYQRTVVSSSRRRRWRRSWRRRIIDLDRAPRPHASLGHFPDGTARLRSDRP